MTTKMNVQDAVSEPITLEKARQGLLATWLQANNNRLGFLVKVKHTIETRFLASEKLHIVFRHTKAGHWKQNDSSLWSMYDIFSHPIIEDGDESLGKRRYEYSFMVRNSDQATVLCSRRISPQGNGFCGSKDTQANRQFVVKTPRGSSAEYVYAKLWGFRDGRFLRGDLTAVSQFLNLPQGGTDIEQANAVKEKFRLYQFAVAHELTYDESLRTANKSKEEVYEEEGIDNLDDYLG